jgi:hypothetical protein
MGFMSYGWDAGVLGGVLLTKAFQAAMKVSFMYLNLGFELAISNVATQLSRPQTQLPLP